MHKEWRTHGGTYKWRQHIHEATTKQKTYPRRGHQTEGTWRGHSYGVDIHAEGTFTRRGHAYGEEVHMKGHTHGGRYTWMKIHTKRNAHGGTYTRRNIHTGKHTHGG